MKTQEGFIMASARIVAFDGDDDDAAAKAAAKAAAEAEAARKAAEAAAGGSDVELTPAQQARVDALIKEQAEKGKRALAELEALKARQDLTANQRKDVESRLEMMQKELLTKEELFEKEKKKGEKKYKEDVERLTEESTYWKTQYTDSTIMRAIADASLAHEAYDSDTIGAILRPNTNLIESHDDDGNPTGELMPKVKFIDPEGKDGKPTELLLTVSEAVKRMSELDKYAYLFKGKGAGGGNFGKGGAKGKTDTLESAAKRSPEAYRELRKNVKL